MNRSTSTPTPRSVNCKVHSNLSESFFLIILQNVFLTQLSENKVSVTIYRWLAATYNCTTHSASSIKQLYFCVPEVNCMQIADCAIRPCWHPSLGSQHAGLCPNHQGPGESARKHNDGISSPYVTSYWNLILPGYEQSAGEVGWIVCLLNSRFNIER